MTSIRVKPAAFGGVLSTRADFVGLRLTRADFVGLRLTRADFVGSLSASANSGELWRWLIDVLIRDVFGVAVAAFAAIGA